MTPLHSSYINNIPQEFKNEFYIFKKKKDSNFVKIYDESKIYGEKSDFFYNSDHLNYKGSYFFTKFIKDSIFNNGKYN